MSTQTDRLWDRYRRRGDQAARAQLLDQYLGLVHHCARVLIKKLAPEVELDDLVSAGTLGLVQAIEAFEPERGLVFSTYGMQRIHGAILDELRSRDWMPRSSRRRQRQLAVTVGALEARLGRTPTPGEVAEDLGVDLDTYWSRYVSDARRHLVPLDAPAGDARDGLRLVESIPDVDTAAPDAGLAYDDQVNEVQEALATLTPLEGLVLALSYYEELNLREIGEVLHVSESRVCQIRTKALRLLRDNCRLREVAA